MKPTHDLKIRVPYRDADPMGLVHHSVYFSYFEMGRTEMLRAAGGRYRDMEEAGLFVVVAKVECSYHRPARYDDLLTIRTTLERVTPARIEHTYLVLRDEEKLAQAKITLAVVDREGELQRVPEWLNPA